MSDLYDMTTFQDDADGFRRIMPVIAFKLDDPCVSAAKQREQDASDCRDWLVINDVLPKTAQPLDATAYFENENDGMCDLCDAVENCPVCERYE